MRVCLMCEHAFVAGSWACPECAQSPDIVDNLPAFAPQLGSSETHFPQGDFEKLVLLEQGNFWFRARNELVVWSMKKYFRKLSSFLEIGCGTGFVLSGIKESFPDVSLWGSELSMAGLKLAKSRLASASLMQMDARKIPFQNEFDAIGLFDVLEHIKEDDLVLEQVRKAVKNSGGGVIITVPQHDFLWSVNDEYACHVRRYSRRELVGKLEKAGFHIELVSSFVSFLLPLMVVSRKTRDLNDYDPLQEFRIPKWLNRSLEAIMAVERASIKAGIRYPAGGSLIAVART